jgi:hypothetical protein
MTALVALSIAAAFGVRAVLNYCDAVSASVRKW